MSTFIVRLGSGDGDARSGDGDGRSDLVTRVAVKDLIDMSGIVTTCGSKALAATSPPAPADAACLAGTRAAEATGQAEIIGKTNLHELAFGVSGVNPWFGTPVNPLDAALVPGGSSSGSAVAVATGEADVAFGSDTGGSIRIPAACCGVVGLKTTRGRISLDGVQALAPSLDTVGPMGATVDATGAGMELLLPGFAWRDRPGASRIGLVRLSAAEWIEKAIEDALSLWEAGGGAGGGGRGGGGAGPGQRPARPGQRPARPGQRRARQVVEVDLPGWSAATEAVGLILIAEAWSVHRTLWEQSGSELSPEVATRLEMGSLLSPDEVAAAWEEARGWSDQLARVFAEVDAIALPVLAGAPPLLENAQQVSAIRHTAPLNLAGVPALAMPVGGGAVPASVQLAGPAYSEEMILATGLELERALARSPD